MPKPSMKSEIKRLEDEIAAWQGRTWKADDSLAIANRQLTDMKRMIDDLVRDKQWLKQLCQEQSSSIAGYMRSR